MMRCAAWDCREVYAFDLPADSSEEIVEQLIGRELNDLDEDMRRDISHSFERFDRPWLSADVVNDAQRGVTTDGMDGTDTVLKVMLVPNGWVTRVYLFASNW